MTRSATVSGRLGIGSPGAGTARLDRAVAAWAFVARLGIALLVLVPLAIVSRIEFGSSRRPALALVVAVTIAVAALVWSLSRPIERWSYRKVHGSEADAYRSMHQLLTRMSTTLDIDDVVGRLAETVGHATRSARAEVSVTLDDGGAWTRVWPDRSDPDSPVEVSRQILHLGEHVGDLRLDGTNGATAGQALDGLAAPAGLALSTVRLTHALRRRRDQLDLSTAELRRSRERLLEVGAEQRRRLGAEIEARVEPHLQSAAAADDPVLAAGELSAALDALRRLARGVFPPRLADDGILVSLQDWAAERGLVLHATGDDAVLRADPEVARCFYFCAVTATDASPVGAPSLLTLDLAEDAAAFELTVATVEPGSAAGLQAGADRAAAFGGSFVGGSAGGTLTITCRIPLAGGGPIMVGGTA